MAVRRLRSIVIAASLLSSGSSLAATGGDEVYRVPRPSPLSATRVDCFHFNADGTFVHDATRLVVTGYWVASTRAFTAVAKECLFTTQSRPCDITTHNDISYGGEFGRGRGRNRGVAQQRDRVTGELVFSLAFDMRRDDSCLPIP